MPPDSHPQKAPDSPLPASLSTASLLIDDTVSIISSSSSLPSSQASSIRSGGSSRSSRSNSPLLEPVKDSLPTTAHLPAISIVLDPTPINKKPPIITTPTTAQDTLPPLAASSPQSRSQTPQRPRRRSSSASVSSLSSDDGTSHSQGTPSLSGGGPSTPGRASATLTTNSKPMPGHPANIYRNLLIMEDSLRQEYISLRNTRRKYLLFNLSMIALTLYFFYCVFIEPSIYRVIHFFNRLFLMIFVITIILFYISGSHRKTMGSSRKFIYNTNKGMRGFNLKLVRIPQTWTETFFDWFWSPAYSARPGCTVKLVLSPRIFNPDIIEAWEIYRLEYWNKEYLKSIGGNTEAPAASSATPKSSRKSFTSANRPSSSLLRQTTPTPSSSTSTRSPSPKLPAASL